MWVCLWVCLYLRSTSACGSVRGTAVVMGRGAFIALLLRCVCVCVCVCVCAFEREGGREGEREGGRECVSERTGALTIAVVMGRGVFSVSFAIY